MGLGPPESATFRTSVTLDAPRLTLRFVDEESNAAHRVDAEVLAESLVHGQRVVHLLAMTAAGREYRERLRVPAELADEFRLVCEVPTPGSYAQPVVLEGSDLVLDVPSRASVMGTFVEVGAALGQGSWEQLRALVPDTVVRQRVMDEYVAFLPDPESGYGIDLIKDAVTYASFRKPQLLAVHEYRRHAREDRNPTLDAETIAGELVSIDFAARTITVRHHPTKRRVVCEYTDDAEEMLVKNRRGLLHVTGTLELDKRDRPYRMTNVYDIQELDLSPVTLNVVEGALRRLRFAEGARSFTPELDSEGKLLVVQDEQLDLHAYAPNRAELIQEISEQIEMLWIEFAETSEELTPAAAALRERLIITLQPIENA